MQTYGLSWNISLTQVGNVSKWVRAYWPVASCDPSGRVRAIDRLSMQDEKRRIGKASGSGPFWHHKTPKTLITPESDADAIYVAAGTYFYRVEGTISPCFGFVSKQDSIAISCRITPSRDSAVSVTMYQFRLAVGGRFNTILMVKNTSYTQSYRGDIYSRVPHTLAQAQKYYNMYSYMLAYRKEYTLFKSLQHEDIVKGSAVELDYSTIIEDYPTPIDFEEDWLNISLLGQPIGRSAMCAQRAYERAAADLPTADVNAFANTMESASMIRNVILSDLGSLLPRGKSYSKAVSATWLAYRYAVCTTKFDVDSYRELIHRLKGLSDVRYVRSHGVYYDHDTGDTYRVTLKLKSRDIGADFTSTLEMLGFRLNLVNAWDMVPYSFIIDWFTNLSGLLEVLDQKSMSAELDVCEAWASRESSDHHTYIRWSTCWTPSLPLLEAKEVSNKTIFMRIADAIALLAH